MFDASNATPRITLPVTSVHDVQPADAAPPQHALLRSTWLHLFPSMLILLFALVVGPPVIRAGFPPLLVPSLWALCVLIPVELGYLLYQAKRNNDGFSLRRIVRYREPMPVRAYLLLVPALLAWGVLAFVLISPRIEPYLVKTFFFWMPAWVFSLFRIDGTGAYARPVLIFTVVLYLITNPAAAWVEELYFRGYLLPRIAHLGIWAPFVSVVLFSLQHLFSPWQNPARILALLPLVYTVAWKKNIYIGIIVHVTLDVLSAAALLFMLYR